MRSIEAASTGVRRLISDMTPEQEKLAFELITNPPPGSKLAEAKRWGIDLTLLLANLKLTPEQRVENVESGARTKHDLRVAGVRHRAKLKKRIRRRLRANSCR